MPAAPPQARWRAIVARTLTVLGLLVVAASILATYVRYEALDTGQFRDTARQLIADQAVRDQLAATMVEQLYSNVDVAAELQQRLPKDQRPLAGPITAALRAGSDRFAKDVLAQPGLQAVAVGALAEAHRTLLSVIEDDKGSLSTTGGNVTLDLNQLVRALADRLGLGAQVIDRLPPSAGQITLLESKDLKTTQDTVRILKVLAAWLWVLVLVLWAAAVWLAAGKRRYEVRAIAIGFVIIGVLVLVIRTLAGRYVVDSLVTTETVRPAAQHAWSIITATLADEGWTALIGGIVALIGVWLVGPGVRARASLRALAPYLRRPDLTYGAFGLLWLLLLWWSPTVQFTRLLSLLLMVGFSGVGLEVVRRIALRRHPDLEAGDVSEALGAAWQRLAAPRPSAVAPTPTNGAHVDGLERLAQLKQQGLLTEDEFRAAKTTLLRG